MAHDAGQAIAGSWSHLGVRKHRRMGLAGTCQRKAASV